MKGLSYGGVLTLLMLMFLPTTSDAFSRRSHSSEVIQSSSTQNGNVTTENGNSAQAVPEPPLLLVMSIGLGAFALLYAIRRHKRPS